MRHSLRDKKIIVNQTLLSKLWYIGQIYTIPNILKWQLEEYTISSGTEKSMASQVSSSVLHLEGWTRYFKHEHSIKLSKNEINSKVINLTNALGKHLILHRLNLIQNSNQGLPLFRQKILKSIIHENL